MSENIELAEAMAALKRKSFRSSMQFERRYEYIHLEVREADVIFNHIKAQDKRIRELEAAL